MENFNIFEMLYDTYKINTKNPLRVIEFFGGYGSQTLALKYLGVKYEHWKLCEWAIPSIIAYASAHRNELEWYGQNFCGDLTKEQIANQLFEYGVSADYNKPATLDQLKRMPEEKLRLCFNSIQWANNLVDISRVKGQELNINDTENFTYLLTYSFPCQDLSLAGKCKGMEKGSGTRSGLLWEVERILGECEHKPQILVMENVTQVHGAGNEEHFREWMLRLEEMGYQNYWKDLSATEFKIPQTRNRTFMISILGDYNYTFPKKTKLDLRLKDLLEPEGTVDEKFYISDKLVNYIPKTEVENQNSLTKPSFDEIYDKLKNSDFQQQKDRIQENNVCDTLLARDYKDPKLIIEKSKRLGGLYDKDGETHQAGSIYDSNYSSPTLDCSSGGGHRQPFIVEKGEKNKSLKETLEKTDLENVDDVAYLDTYNRNAITDGTAKTILTGVDYRNHDFLLIKNATKKGYLEAHEGDGIDISSRMDSHRGTVQKGMAQTITTAGGENVGVVIKDNSNNKNDDILKKELCNKLIEDGLVEEYDVVKHSYTSQIMDGNKKCVEKSDGVMITLTTRGDCLGVVVKDKEENNIKIPLKRGYDYEIKPESDNTDEIDFIGNYSKSGYNQTSVVGKNGVAPTVTENHGQVTAVLAGGIGEKKSNGGTQYYQQDRVYDSNNVAISVTTGFNPYYQTENNPVPKYKPGLRIRKLTPRECFRLQGVKDEDIDLIMQNQSNSLGYHLAGDSICITVLMGIFSKLFDIDWLEHFNPKEWWKN